MPSVIALDAMGSDKAPKPEIEGALQAARHHGVSVLLVGPEPRLRADWPVTLERAGCLSKSYTPAKSLPWKTKWTRFAASAIRRSASDCAWCAKAGLRLCYGGQYRRSHGHRKVVLGALPGVDRPALAAAFPTVNNTAAVLLDVGANVDCTAVNLEQFAVMGEIYCRTIFGKKRPRVGCYRLEKKKAKETT